MVKVFLPFPMPAQRGLRKGPASATKDGVSPHIAACLLNKEAQSPAMVITRSMRLQ